MDVEEVEWRAEDTQQVEQEEAGAESQKEGDEVEELREGKAQEAESKATEEEREQGREAHGRRRRTKRREGRGKGENRRNGRQQDRGLVSCVMFRVVACVLLCANAAGGVCVLLCANAAGVVWFLFKEKLCEPFPFLVNIPLKHRFTLLFGHSLETLAHHVRRP